VQTIRTDGDCISEMEERPISKINPASI